MGAREAGRAARWGGSSRRAPAGADHGGRRRRCGHNVDARAAGPIGPHHRRSAGPGADADCGPGEGKRWRGWGWLAAQTREGPLRERPTHDRRREPRDGWERWHSPRLSSGATAAAAAAATASEDCQVTQPRHPGASVVTVVAAQRHHGAAPPRERPRPARRPPSRRARRATRRATRRAPRRAPQGSRGERRCAAASGPAYDVDAGKRRSEVYGERLDGRRPVDAPDQSSAARPGWPCSRRPCSRACSRAAAWCSCIATGWARSSSWCAW